MRVDVTFSSFSGADVVAMLQRTRHMHVRMFVLLLYVFVQEKFLSLLCMKCIMSVEYNLHTIAI